jgi:hypothetical protein
MKKIADISLPKSNLYLEGSGLDRKGNRVVKLGMSSLPRIFSIQTNGNLPKTYNILRGLKIKKEMQSVSESDLQAISLEIVEYIKVFGTELQIEKLRTYST